MENKQVSSNFIKNIIIDDLESGKHKDILTRFPPEPNGYLHIGHAKSIVLNFDLADEFKGRTNVRFDDTNPVKEDTEYVESIKEDVKWLGYSWDGLYFASDYFEEMYNRAVLLIKKGKAYVCELSANEIRETRGTLNRPGQESPYRSRSVEENLDLFTRMRSGEFPDGEKVLRAKIDMASPNLNMRDPVIYRIAHASHHNTGDKWCIYPMYDYAHPIEDAVEGITHSICTLEFEDHRPLYDWVIRECEMECQPRQIEFARLNMTNTVMSKRKLKLLVDEGVVDGWDDPRMPTISGLRRRGYTPEAIREFCARIGVAKNDNLVDIALLEHCVRDDLNERAPRAMAVLRPLKLIIDNYPEGQVEEIDCPIHPQKPQMGTRKVPFSRVIYIENDDFMENPPKKYKRLGPGREVRLRNSYVIRLVSTVKNESTGEVMELHCTYDPDTRNAAPSDGRKVEGVIHWVSAEHAIPATIRLYDRLFKVADPAAADGEFATLLNPESLETIHGCYVESSLACAQPEDRYQFERLGYFCADRKDTSPERPVFNRIVSLRDSWARMVK